MAEMAWVTVRVDKLIDGDQIHFGVPVRFRPVVMDTTKQIRHFDLSRKMVTTIAPVSSSDSDTAGVYLAWGDYDVEAVLPSGEPLAEELSVELDANVPAYDTINVVLRGEHSPDEWRSWAHFTGAPLASLRQLRLEAELGQERYDLAPDIRSRFAVTVGSIAHSALPGGFDPTSWDAWFDFLEERYRRGPDFPPGIELDEDDSGLDVEIEGGYGQTPLRIKFVQRNAPKIRRDARDIGERRTYTAIAGSSGTRLVALPLPWGDDGADSVGFTRFELLAFEDGDQLRCDPVLRDGRWAGLVAYLNRGRVDLASEILKSAHDALFRKFENPLAVAVGGYVLLSSDIKDKRASWPAWLENLAHNFPHLPDGLILRARWLLSHNNEEHLNEAHNLLFESIGRGIPYFTTGVVWLIEGLEQTSIGCPACTELLRRVRGVARSMDLSQAFTSFSIANASDQGGASAKPTRHDEPINGGMGRPYTSNEVAWEYFMRGAELYRRFTPKDNANARALFEQAIDIDPKFARAYASLSFTHRRDYFGRWSKDPASSEDLAHRMAKKAVELARSELDPKPSLPFALEQLGWGLLYRGEYKEAIEAAKESVQLNHNYADGYALWAQVLVYLGEPQEALDKLKKADDLNRIKPFYYDYYRGQAYYVLGVRTSTADREASQQHFEQAEIHLRDALTKNDNYRPARSYLAAVLSELGRPDEAKNQMNISFQKGEPLVPLLRSGDEALIKTQIRAMTPFEDQTISDRLEEAWRKAAN